jgi:hypothetical protein
MTRHAGISLALSFLLVGCFAILLYHPDPAPPGPAAGQSVRSAGSDPSVQDRMTAGEAVPLERATTAAPERTAQRGTTRTDDPPTGSRLILASGAEIRPDPSPAVRGGSRPSASARSRPAFTEVGQGESLTDVASRVYGTGAAARTLRQSNRDLLGEQEAPLRAGMVLRTP